MNQTVKPLAAGACAFLLDKYYLGEKDMNRSLMFGAVTGAGVYLSEMVAPLVAVDLPSSNKQLYSGKTLMTRLIEVGLSSGGVFVVNKYLLRNDIYRDELLQRMGIIAVADVVSTYVQEYLGDQPLSFLV